MIIDHIISIWRIFKMSETIGIFDEKIKNNFEKIVIRVY